jgi:hypothetical protein
VVAEPEPFDLIPDADSVRRRLAAVLTEAHLLRAQLRVSRRLEKERERLAQLPESADRKAVADA